MVVAQVSTGTKWDGRNRELRNALHLDGIPLKRHAIKIEELQKLYPHTIVKSNKVATAPFVLCLPYALGLPAIVKAKLGTTYTDVMLGKNLKIVGVPFAEWLMGGRLEPISQPKVGCIIFYFESAMWRHAGRLVGTDVVNSQWGVFPAYEHGVWEVPLSYGEEIRYYNMPSENEVARLFMEYGQLNDLCGVVPPQTN